MRTLVAIAVLASCSGEITGAAAPDTTPDATPDATPRLIDAVPAVDAPPDARVQPECEWGGAPGTCLSAQACGAIPDHTLETGACATGLGCCIQTPDPADNPPVPDGYRLMRQADVTAEMTAWAVDILHDHVTYPMWATTTRQFGALLVLARVEWHVPDFQNSIIHRGVTLYVPR